MAYIFRLSSDLSWINCDFVGGEPQKTTMVPWEGGGTREFGFETFFLFSKKMPEAMFSHGPRRVNINPNPDGEVGDVGPAPEYDTLIVSDKLKSLISRFEPNLHQFIRVPEVAIGGALDGGKKFWLLNVLVQLAAVSIEKSRVRFKERNGLRHMGPRGFGKEELSLQKSVIDGHHLWRGTREQLQIYSFCSDALHDAILNENIRGLDFRHCSEV
ncbi:MAG: hypothetical protein RIC14_11145 [Filomicrobium sp.]